MFTFNADSNDDAGSERVFGEANTGSVWETLQKRFCDDGVVPLMIRMYSDSTLLTRMAGTNQSAYGCYLDLLNTKASELRKDGHSAPVAFFPVYEVIAYENISIWAWARNFIFTAAFSNAVN